LRHMHGCHSCCGVWTREDDASMRLPRVR
jgi:hypothetical protein